MLETPRSHRCATERPAAGLGDAGPHDERGAEAQLGECRRQGGAVGVGHHELVVIAAAEGVLERGALVHRDRLEGEADS